MKLVIIAWVINWIVSWCPRLNIDICKYDNGKLVNKSSKSINWVHYNKLLLEAVHTNGLWTTSINHQNRPSRCKSLTSFHHFFLLWWRDYNKLFVSRNRMRRKLIKIQLSAEASIFAIPKIHLLVLIFAIVNRFLYFPHISMNGGWKLFCASADEQFWNRCQVGLFNVGLWLIFKSTGSHSISS